MANQFSIAGVLGVDENKHPYLASISNGFLGNTFSGISDAATHVLTGHFGAAYGDALLGGTAQGLPIGSTVSSRGVTGVLTEAAIGTLTKPGYLLSLTGTASQIGAESMVGPVGWAKLGMMALLTLEHWLIAEPTYEGEYTCLTELYLCFSWTSLSE